MSSSEQVSTPTLDRATALRHFASFRGPTQSQQHIRPLHEYIAARLVLEGGFAPDDLLPHPPLQVTGDRAKPRLAYALARATRAEATILGGLKTKSVDIVVTKQGIGPVLAISCKGMTGAFRNLTNRLEETIGECTNIHIGYPMLVFGYLFLARANRANAQTAANDVAVNDGNEPVEALVRFHAALSEMTGRLGVRNDASRYEAVGMGLVDTQEGLEGRLLDTFPPPGSRVRLDQFFNTLYRRYDERFVVGAPTLATRTRRRVWDPDSAILQDSTLAESDYPMRTGD